MSRTNQRWKNQGKAFEYLCVDEFIGDIFQARALSTAFETGLIDALLRHRALSSQFLMEQKGQDGRGMRLLLGLLQESGGVEKRNDTIMLSEAFSQAIKYRDLLEMKSALANWTAHDFLNCFSDMVSNPDQAFRKMQFCRLFSYDRCFSHSRENEEATRRWMRITTTLTKYEAPVCLQYHDLSPYRKMLDIGGNSGEFALRICKRYKELQAVVFDLPLVCMIGRQHLQPEPEADRISFVTGNALTDALPGGFDLVTFKSMLHDWPEKEAMHFITNASRALVPGGTMLIFERGPIEIEKAELSYSMLPMLLFFHSFRSPEIYEMHLKELGFQNLVVRWIDLDTPFFLLTAQRM